MWTKWQATLYVQATEANSDDPGSDSYRRIDALIVTIPSETVRSAIQQAVDSGLPVFGFNVGYDVFDELGVISWVAQEEYRAGVKAAEEFLRLQEIRVSSTNATILNSQMALFVNHQKGNQGLDERYNGFRETLLHANSDALVQELVVEINSDGTEATHESMENAMQGCYYAMILTAGVATAPTMLQAAEKYSCHEKTTIATFDFSKELQKDILLEQLAFALDQQEYLQAALPVVLATTYATTSSSIVPTIEAKTYLSGPTIVNQENLATDSLTACEDEAFPICPKDNNAENEIGSGSSCSCIDRSKIRIGGVLHGHTSDLFWDPIYLAAENAAKDMGVQLENERFSPEEDSEVLKDKMAAQMKSLCEGSSIDGLFVTIPESQAIFDAIKICQRLNVPVIAVNSDPRVSKQVGVPHIGQDEYGAGYLSGQRMVEAGMKEGYCHGQSAHTGVTARCTGFADAVRAAGLNVTIVEAPIDLDSRFTLFFEDAVGRDVGDPWTGVGWLVGGRTLEPTLRVQEQHPDLLLGMSDVAPYGDIIFKAMDEGKLLFTFDQQPFLQGNLPVYLLTYMIYTKQSLLDDIIMTGPNFITARPTPKQVSCEANMWAVCANIPEENLNYISKGWLGVGGFLAGITILSGMISLFWLVVSRDKAIVKANQPPFFSHYW